MRKYGLELFSRACFWRQAGLAGFYSKGEGRRALAKYQ
jgi:hypothetical protein